MSTQDKDYNFFDDTNLWEETGITRKSNRQSSSVRSRDDDLDNFYDDYLDKRDGLDSETSRTSIRRRKEKVPPLLLVAAVLAIVVLGSRFLGNHAEETPPPPVNDSPVLLQTEPQQVPTAPVPTEPPTVTPKEYRYFCKMLTPDQQKVYEIIRDGISRHEDHIGPFNVKNGQELDLILQTIIHDWPEYFWFRGGHNSSYYDRETYWEYTLCPDYVFSKQEYAACAAYIEAETRDIIQELSGKSDYEKVKGVYEFLIDRTIYDLAYTGTTIYELFHEGRAVCEGYARASQYLLTKLGVEALYVSGDAGEYTTPMSQWEGHAWNIVKIEGIYYQLDTTWGDPVCDDGIQRKSFHYLNLTDMEMARCHKRDDWNYYPPCTDIRYNYYYIEGRYLDSFNKELILYWFQEAYNRNEPMTFKCADEYIYQSARNWLLSEGGVDQLYRSVLPESSGYTYSYSCTDELYILSIERV